MRTRSRVYLTLIAATLIAAGCKTTPKPEAPVMALPHDFVPVAAVSQLHQTDGRYPNLFSTNSGALWVDAAVAQAKLQREESAGTDVSPLLESDAAAIASNYYVVEMNLASEFPDASIAYDVVGLRNVDLYLLLPDGTRVWPIQRVMGSTARETSAGALKAFGRTNIVAFPKRDVLTGQPTIPNGISGLQLVLDGFNSLFHFEWAAVPQDSPQPVTPAESGGLTFSGIFEKLRELSRMTQ